MDLKTKVYNTLCNHRNCTSSGIAHLLNVPRYSVLRVLSELIRENSVRMQKGGTEDGLTDPRFRSYKLAKPKYEPIKLFEEPDLKKAN
jgi:transcription initiation factor IIE alpha subunit